MEKMNKWVSIGCFVGKSITFYYELTLFEFKIASATSQQKGMDWEFQQRLVS